MSLFSGAPAFRARALYLGERLDTRALESTSKLAQAPLAIHAGAQGIAVLFRYGAVVLFHVSPLEEAGLREQLTKYLGEAFAKPEAEEIEIRINDAKPDGVEAGVMNLTEVSIERVQLIAEILARSVALARYEGVVRESFAAIEPWAQRLHQRGTGRRVEKDLLKNLGSTLLIQHSMAGRIEIDDKPEVLWERPDLERLYARLDDEYELEDRDSVLERKLALISATADMLLNLVNNRHARRLEWYIIALIAFEIGITLTSLAFGWEH